ncbi:hypothetical protein CRG98_013525 [Punica granatum]|uniref:Uncharacterized protein n=1 Tax=Punica granatum TaxID=22663 RepID=A0A2I0KC16_PUNGR|nr:hypothetical protein CRG98_013525 [Punica granatum]
MEERRSVSETRGTESEVVCASAFRGYGRATTVGVRSQWRQRHVGVGSPWRLEWLRARGRLRLV